MVMLVALAVGALGASLVAWWLSERERTTMPPHVAPRVAEGVESVLTVLRSSALLVGPDDAVLKASAPAYALGLAEGDRVAPEELAATVRAVRRDGQIRETELVLPRDRRHGPSHVLARVAPLSSQLILVLAEDRTRERRVEMLRRDFVGNVSHELKTPVGALNLLAEAVREAAEDPEAVRRFSGRMLIESERLTRLVQQIIELSRLQDDMLIDEPVEISLEDVVMKALDHSRTDAVVRHIELVARCDPELRVQGNPEQLLVAVSNLVENAVTYSPDGSRVAVMAERERAPEPAGDLDPADAGLAAITVSDQGIGIAQSELDRIFERFYRVDPARARATGGTGLGLSIVKHVAASHGGDVRVWSIPGQGSSFSIRLPLPPTGPRHELAGDVPVDPARTLREPTIASGPEVRGHRAVDSPVDRAHEEAPS